MLPKPSLRRHRLQEDKELQITSFLNLLVVLIPFLLITAVFSRLAILEISLPTPSKQAVSPASSPSFHLTLIIRPGTIEVRSGTDPLAAVSRSEGGDGGDDMSELSRTLEELKDRYPESTGATILSQQDIPYQTLIQVMDVAREAGFPDIAIGEAKTP